MLKNLMIPLDGSSLAEAAAPAAVCLAQALGARITLLHVIEYNPPKSIHHEHHLANVAEAKAYLEQAARRLIPATVTVEQHVHESRVRDVPQSIVEHAEEMPGDLIVMCTHGRGGPRRWMFGSNAQQVAALGTTPLLLIPPSQTMHPADSLKHHRLLVPLDGEPTHEQSLSVASDLARACGATLYLLAVVHNVQSLHGERAAAASMLPATMTAVLEIEQENAELYLQGVASKLKQSGLAVEYGVRRGKRVDTILEAARDIQADVIVLSTHGKTGADAFWSASVAPRVALRAEVPILLVPVKDNKEAPHVHAGL
jgi:nucleotide-binding universal stress UspA family protein